jgi:hypothetical protein
MLSEFWATMLMPSAVRAASWFAPLKRNSPVVFCLMFVDAVANDVLWCLGGVLLVVGQHDDDNGLGSNPEEETQSLMPNSSVTPHSESLFTLTKQKSDGSLGFRRTVRRQRRVPILVYGVNWSWCRLWVSIFGCGGEFSGGCFVRVCGIIVGYLPHLAAKLRIVSCGHSFGGQVSGSPI